MHILHISNIFWKLQIIRFYKCFRVCLLILMIMVFWGWFVCFPIMRTKRQNITGNFKWILVILQYDSEGWKYCPDTITPVSTEMKFHCRKLFYIFGIQLVWITYSFNKYVMVCLWKFLGIAENMKCLWLDFLSLAHLFHEIFPPAFLSVLSNLNFKPFLQVRQERN